MTENHKFFSLVLIVAFQILTCTGIPLGENSNALQYNEQPPEIVDIMSESLQKAGYGGEMMDIPNIYDYDFSDVGDYEIPTAPAAHSIGKRYAESAAGDLMGRIQRIKIQNARNRLFHMLMGKRSTPSLTDVLETLRSRQAEEDSKLIKAIEALKQERMLPRSFQPGSDEGLRMKRQAPRGNGISENMGPRQTNQEALSPRDNLDTILRTPEYLLMNQI